MNLTSPAPSLRIAFFAVFFLGAATPPAIGSLEGCQEAKVVAKDVLGLTDALCLSGVLDRTDMTDEQKMIGCGIAKELWELAQAFLVKQKAIIEAKVAARVGAAQAASPCGVTKDAGK